MVYIQVEYIMVQHSCKANGPITHDVYRNIQYCTRVFLHVQSDAKYMRSMRKCNGSMLMGAFTVGSEKR